MKMIIIAVIMALLINASVACNETTNHSSAYLKLLKKEIEDAKAIRAQRECDFLRKTVIRTMREETETRINLVIQLESYRHLHYREMEKCLQDFGFMAEYKYFSNRAMTKLWFDVYII